MPRIIRACGPFVLAALAACHHRGVQAVAQDAAPLATFATQHVVVTPTTFVRATDSLGWVARLGTRGTARLLDSAIVSALDARGLVPRWILPAQLERSYEHNRTYATDPYQLTADALRASSFTIGSRYADPLASQLRTMIALEEDSRFVLVPVELRFDKGGGAGGTQGRATLRVALVDARSTEAKWVGDVQGDAASSPTGALASVAGRLADYFARP